jgi:hypothetical protein
MGGGGDPTLEGMGRGVVCVGMGFDFMVARFGGQGGFDSARPGTIAGVGGLKFLSNVDERRRWLVQDAILEGSMSDLRCATRLLALAIAMVPIACGDPATMAPPSGRRLETITISPATADAQGQAVQFTATGHWSAAPLTTTPQPAQWGACQNNAATTEVTVSSSGTAACASGAKGAFTVFAYDPTNCNAITVCGGGCTILGTAQLTCP